MLTRLHCVWTPTQNQYGEHIFKELSHLSISMFFIQTVQPRSPTPNSPLRLGVIFECQPVTRMSSPIIPSDRWKENPMETGHYQPSFLKEKKKRDFLLTVTLCCCLQRSHYYRKGILCVSRIGALGAIEIRVSALNLDHVRQMLIFSFFFWKKWLHVSFSGTDMCDDNNLDKLMRSIKVMKVL